MEIVCQLLGSAENWRNRAIISRCRTAITAKINCFHFHCEMWRTPSSKSRASVSRCTTLLVSALTYYLILLYFSIRLYLKHQFINISQCATGFCLKNNNKAKQSWNSTLAIYRFAHINARRVPVCVCVCARYAIDWVVTANTLCLFSRKSDAKQNGDHTKSSRRTTRK